MKRIQAVEPPYPTICHDVMLLIARVSKWQMSGPMARTSKEMLRLFTRKEVLHDIMKDIMATDGVLLRWLLLSLPYSLLFGDTPPQPLANLSQVTFEKPSFVTGGAVCQQFYHKSWYSDIDVFIQFSTVYHKRKQIYVCCQCIDLVPCLTDITRCIEQFDLSVVQMGYCHEKCEHYATPLALYTFQHNVLVVIPTKELINYTVPFTGMKQGSTIWTYIDRHEKSHDKQFAYHECPTCEDDATHGRGHRCFVRCRRRIQKYVARFPDFEMIYCKASPLMKRDMYDYSPLLLCEDGHSDDSDGTSTHTFL